MTTSPIPAQETGGPEDYIPVLGFASRHVFLTKRGDFGIVLEMPGTEYECLDPEDLDAIARRFQKSSRTFNEEFRIYQHVMKAECAPVPRREYDSPIVELAVQERIRQVSAGTSISAYLVILFCRYRRPVTIPEKLKHAFVSRWNAKVLGAALKVEVAAAAQELLSLSKTLVEQMADVSPLRILDRDGVFRFFRRLLNPDWEIADAPMLKPSRPLPRQIDSTHTSIFQDHLQQGEHYTRVMTLKDPPLETSANLLRPIIESDSQCILTTEWHQESNDKMRKLILSRKNHVLVYTNVELAKGIGATLIQRDNAPPAPDPEPSPSQKEAAALLDTALSAMENHGLTFGFFSLTLVVRDTDPHRLALSVSRLYKAFAKLGIDVYPETLGLWRQYIATIPGNDNYNKRYQYLSATNYADLSMLFLPQRGEAVNPALNDEYLIALSSRQGTPYLLNLHWGDSPHAFFCGVNGSGKTYAVNAFVTHAQKYNPWTLILDIGGSYRTITERFGGSYLEMDPSKMGCTINPFCLPPTPKNFTFLYSFVRLLIESGEYKLTDDDKRDVFQRIVAMYEYDAAVRCLGFLRRTLRGQPRQHLSRWVREDDLKREGQYGKLFDNLTDTLTLARFQTCDFTGLDDVPEIAEPLLFYVLHRSRAHVYDLGEANVLKLCVADESWRLLDTEITRRYLINALKTWRKYNAAMWMITQQPEDLRAAGTERILKEAQTTVLFANPRMDEAVAREYFKLNETEIAQVKGLQAKRELMVKKPFSSKVCVFDSSEAEIALFSSTPQKRQKELMIA